MDEETSVGNKFRPWLQRLKLSMLTPSNREELVLLLRNIAKDHNVIAPEALTMIEGVLQVAEMQVRDIMVPKSQMVAIEKTAALNVSLPNIIESGHSRFPVLGENRDEIVGTLLAKDLLKYAFQTEHIKQMQIDLSSIIRPAVFVPESKRIDLLLGEFRLKRNHMAIVVNEYGGVSGLVTIEDVLEQIVGEIEDEYDVDDEPYIKKHSETKYTIKALTPIEIFNEHFGVNFSDEDYDTVGGLVMRSFGYLPKRGESIRLDGFKFKILHADNRRIRLLLVTMKK